MTILLRYLRLYAACLRFSCAKALQFRFDFLFRILMDVIYYAVNLLFFQIVLLHTHAIAGWAEPQLMIFVAFFLVVDAINMTVTSNNIWWLPQYINKGELDYYLIRPASSFFLLTLREFSLNSLVNLMLALGILGWAIGRYPESWSVMQWIGLAVLLINASGLFFLLQLIAVLPTFWTHSPKGFSPIFWMLTRFQERPDRIYVGPLRIVLTTILPFCLVSSFPIRLLLEPWDWSIAINLLLGSIGIWAFTLWLWNRGLANYTSASS